MHVSGRPIGTHNEVTVLLVNANRWPVVAVILEINGWFRLQVVSFPTESIANRVQIDLSGPHVWPRCGTRRGTEFSRFLPPAADEGESQPVGGPCVSPGDTFVSQETKIH